VKPKIVPTSIPKNTSKRREKFALSRAAGKNT
jgi:hypothetical protein